MKISVVGDAGVGKTSFIMALTKLKDGEGDTKSPRSDPVPYKLKGTLTLHHGDRDLVFHDTSAHKDHIRLRQSTYKYASVILCLFSVDSPPSFSSTRNNWEAEIKHCSKGAPWLLVGNKTDLRATQDDCISTSSGQQQAKELNVSYMECSAWTGEGVQEIIEKLTTYDLVEDKGQEEEEDEGDTPLFTPRKRSNSKCVVL
uniref:Uncharacterized protein n=1 Tax=Arcella intermedia TaxID=1963864 RepID=A0A6B2LIM9_9EUKA